MAFLAQADVVGGSKVDLWEQVTQLSPLVLLTLGVLLMLGLELTRGRGKVTAGRIITVGALAVSMLMIVLRLATLWEPIGTGAPILDPARRGYTLLFLQGAYHLHPVHLTGHLLVLGAALATALMSFDWFDRDEDRSRRGEIGALLLMMPVGAMLMISGANLMVCFLGLEILSLSLYILCAIRPGSQRGAEAGMKYFLLGAFAAAFFLFGMALVYAGGGDLGVRPFTIAWDNPPEAAGLAALGGGMIFLALLFKGSLFPFQMWTPDVYQGAPTPVTALMSTGTKTAAFVLMMAAGRFVPPALFPVVPVLAILTMLAGNLGAIRQTNLKRMLAYSGIAHAGYLLVGVNSLLASAQWRGDAQLITRFVYFYLVGYVLANLGAFGILAWLERDDSRAVELDSLNGLARRHPWGAGGLTLFLLSLGGIPPTAGFAGKFLLFSQAFRQEFYLLASLGLLFSAISLYYYLRVAVRMYMHPAEEETPLARPSLTMGIPIVVCGAGVVLLGLFFNLVLQTLWGVDC